MSKDTYETTFCVSLGLKNKYYDIENYFYQELNNINHAFNNYVYCWIKNKASARVAVFLVSCSYDNPQKRDSINFSAGNGNFRALFKHSICNKDAYELLPSCKYCENHMLSGVDNKDCLV